MIYHTRDFGNRHIIIWPILVMSREIQAYRSGTNVPRVIIFCEELSLVLTSSVKSLGW